MMERVVSVRDRQLRRLITGGRLPRVALIFLVGVAGASLCVRAEAQAAAPEAPEVEVLSRQATSAFLRGVLSPGKEDEGGTYEFLYKASGTECEGAGHAPESPGLSFGLEREEVFESLSGLEPNTEYTVCLRAENTKGEAAVSSSVTFKTALPPETPETKPATEVAGTTAKFNGILNPNQSGEPGTYRFIYKAGTECNTGAESETPSEPSLGHKEEAVSAQVTELLPTTTYAYCLQASNAAGESALGPTVTFRTGESPPAISTESFSDLGATEATITAHISPGGAPTTYHVDYGPNTPELSLPASATPVAVRQRLVALQPATEYHFRFVAHNALGTVEGPVMTFTTATAEASSTSTLPDGRAYELVSSAAFLGEIYDPVGPGAHGEEGKVVETGSPFRAASDGDAVTYLADPEPEGGNGNSGGQGGNQYLARRGANAGPGGWETRDITPPAAEGESANEAIRTGYESFMDDLSVGFLHSASQHLAAAAEPPGPPNCETVMYSHTSSDGQYQALFGSTQTSGFCGQYRQRGEQHFLFAGASADGSQTLLESSAALTPDATQTMGIGNNLYDSASGVAHLVNVLPDGEAYPHATFGGPKIEGAGSPDFDGVISPSGSRIVWSTVESEGEAQKPTAIYVRENATHPPSPTGAGGECTVPTGACTVQVDAAEAKASGVSGGGRFWAASGDGTRIFFTDCNRLTTGSTAVSSEGCEHLGGPFGEETVLTGGDLYEYDFAKPPSERLTDLTVDHNPDDSLGADVQGVLAASEDGSYIYFVAGGALDSEPNRHGEHPTSRRCETSPGGSGERAEEERGHLPAGKGCNLYLLRVGQPLKFIAALAADDDHLSQGPSGNSGDWAPSLGSRTAEATGDGTHLVFESTQDLTGYDTGPLAGLEAVQRLEVFVYSVPTGRLSCASCDPGGVNPDPTIEGGSTSTGAGTHLPVSSSNTFMPRWINTEGTQVFFDSSQPLLPQDVNRRQDVYEWEDEGSISCPAKKPARLDGGCIFLLSGGEGNEYSYLVDASANGSNVFLTHRGPLGQAGPRDDKVHLYDVRVDGGFPQTSLACTGTACQGVAPAPPTFKTPSSATFNGVGNFSSPASTPVKHKTAPRLRQTRLSKALSACRKKRSKHKRRACEAQARKRYGTSPMSKKSTNAKKAGEKQRVRS